MDTLAACDRERAPRVRRRLGSTAMLVLALVAAGAAFLYLVGVDILEGRVDFQFYADSVTYHRAARGDLPGFEGIAESVAIAGNFLGPLLILQLAQENYYAVLLINACIFFASIASIARTMRLDSLRLAGLLLLNPLTVSSLLSVNKEIISLAFVALLIKALRSRSILALVSAALISLMVRWQLFVFLVALIALVSPLNPWRERRLVTLAALLAALSILYLQLAPTLEPIRIVFEESAAEYEGSGLYEALQRWQEGGGYWIVFPFKAAHLLFGLGLRFDRLLAPTDFYNDGWQLLHSTMLLVLFIQLVRTRTFRVANDAIYLSIIYVMIFGMSPIYSPRYFYPVYVFWALAMVTRGSESRLFRSAADRRPTRSRKLKLRPSAPRGQTVPDRI